MSAIDAENLGRRYGSHWALRGCSLQIPTGRVVGLVGPNGAGKTTLLHLAVGLLDPSEGRIATLGSDPRRHREVLERVGFVAQDTPLYPTFTVADTLTLGRRLNRNWDDVAARERLAALDIPLGRRVANLSGGQRAQVSLALALATEVSESMTAKAKRMDSAPLVNFRIDDLSFTRLHISRCRRPERRREHSPSLSTFRPCRTQVHGGVPVGAEAQAL